MDEVAEAAGISKPLVYSYFGSKEGLFLACVDGALAGLMAAVEAAARDRSLPLDQRLFRGLLAVFAFIEENREAWAVLYPRGPYTAGGPFAAGAERASEAMAELLVQLFTETAVESGIDPSAAALGEPMAHATVAAVESMAAWWLRHPEESKELQALRLMNFVWMGFGDMLEGRLYIPPAGALP